MKKHLLSFILAAIGMAGVNVASAVEIGGVNYTLDDATMTATVMSSLSYAGDLDLSQGVTYDGKNYSITKIEDGAFTFNSKLGSVVLPSTITEIGGDAFRCSSLSGELVIPGSVTVMGGSAFRETNITSLTIFSGPWKKRATDERPWDSDGGTKAASTFMDCKNLKSVTFPDNMGWSTIPTQIFDGCTALLSLQLPNDAGIIAPSAFQNTALESVVIPASVYQIELYAFYNAPLVQVQVQGSDVNLSLDQYAFARDDEHPSTLKYFFISRKNPPTLSDPTWDAKKIFGGNFNTMKLSLQGAAEANRQAYEESSVWKPFVDNGSLTAINGVAAEVAASAEIYNLHGVKVYTGPVEGLSLPGGIYLVKQGDRVAKIVF